VTIAIGMRCGRGKFGTGVYFKTNTYVFVGIGINSGMHRRFWMDLTASSAVNCTVARGRVPAPRYRFGAMAHSHQKNSSFLRRGERSLHLATTPHFL